MNLAEDKAPNRETEIKKWANMDSGAVGMEVVIR